MNSLASRILCATSALALTALFLAPAPLLAPQVKGLKEKVHFPLYDAVTIKRGETARAVITRAGHQLVLFDEAQGKSKLETNMPLLKTDPRFFSYEITGLSVTIAGGTRMDASGTPDDSGEGNLLLVDSVLHGSTTTLRVGEKIMLQHPTFYFPAGGGTHAAPAEGRSVATSGVPSSAATFRFAEPVLVEKPQGFRVEIEFPDRDLVEQDLATVFGPARIWVTLDGFLTRTGR